jgi:hypothetical protein
VTGPKSSHDRGDDRGQAQAAKDGSGEIEEVGHRERVVADSAMGQQRADVGDEGQVARLPESPAEQPAATMIPTTA